MKWVSTKKALPEKSGEYFVACTSEGRKKPYCYMAVYYSAKNEQFNCYDHQKKREPYEWADVSHWAEIEAPGEDTYE